MSLKKPTAMDIRVLFTTYNRLEFTKKSLNSLIGSNCGEILIFDNGSTDGTQEWLKTLESKKVMVVQNTENIGVAGAMNYFFENTSNEIYVAKIDNDTVVPVDWLDKLLASAINCRLDIVQAKHSIMRQSHVSGDFDTWMKTLETDAAYKNIHYSSHVGGTAILIRRAIIDERLESKWVLGGWDKFQSEHSELRIAFDSSVEVALLDTESGAQIHDNNRQYYKETKRKNLNSSETIARLTKQTIELVDTNSKLIEENKNLNNQLKSIHRSRSYKLISSLRRVSRFFFINK
jgi:glycosyltransferase involved in cell wall biosynthesis